MKDLVKRKELEIARIMRILHFRSIVAAKKRARPKNEKMNVIAHNEI